MVTKIPEKDNVRIGNTYFEDRDITLDNIANSVQTEKSIPRITEPIPRDVLKKKGWKDPIGRKKTKWEFSFHDSRGFGFVINEKHCDQCGKMMDLYALHSSGMRYCCVPRMAGKYSKIYVNIPVSGVDEVCLECSEGPYRDWKEIVFDQRIEEWPGFLNMPISFQRRYFKQTNRKDDWDKVKDMILTKNGKKKIVERKKKPFVEKNQSESQLSSLALLSEHRNNEEKKSKKPKRIKRKEIQNSILREQNINTNKQVGKRKRKRQLVENVQFKRMKHDDKENINKTENLDESIDTESLLEHILSPRKSSDRESDYDTMNIHELRKKANEIGLKTKNYTADILRGMLRDLPEI